ncbi:MAG: ribonuclease III [Simkania sp.]|nr:ribonuclease III [Simkania sp.]
MEIFERFLEELPLIEEKIGYAFLDKNLLIQAFVHRSFLNEHRSLVKEHNERLEFLGDSVLGLIVAEFLFLQLPGHPEGELSRLRSQFVEASMCSYLTGKLDLAPYVLLGKGERMNDGRGRVTILADLLEALLAAIYLDGGLEAARTFFLTHFGQDLGSSLQEPGKNWKARLQDWAQKHHKTTPIYQVLSETGPDHSKVFRVAALIDEGILGEGEGMSKKLAEQAAAEAAMRKLEEKSG